MDRYLILGSNSFSGAHFCKMALQKGHHVVATSRSKEQLHPFLPYRWQHDEPLNFKFKQLDINSDLDSFTDTLNEFKPNLIVNFAAQSMVAQSWECPQHWVNTNTMAVTNIVSRLKQNDSLTKFIQITTPEVYGATSSLISEDAAISPSTPYAASRAAGDMMLKVYHDHFNFPVVFTRAANVYGEGQQLYRIIPRAILACLTGQKLTLDGGGVSVRSFIHIDDVCDATFAIAHSSLIGETFHISTNEFISISELVQKIAEMLNIPFEEVVTLGSERRGKDQAYFLDSSKIRNELGWSEKIKLENGIGRAIAWVKNHLDLFKNMEIGYVHKP